MLFFISIQNKRKNITTQFCNVSTYELVRRTEINGEEEAEKTVLCVNCVGLNAEKTAKTIEYSYYLTREDSVNIEVQKGAKKTSSCRRVIQTKP